MFEENKIKIRQAKMQDIPQILELEAATWGKERAATFEMLKSRIKTFPEGTIVTLMSNKITGFISTEIVNYNFKKNTSSWYEMTDNGYITKTHNPNGDTLYGVNLSVHPLYQRRGIGKKLMASVGRLAIKYNLKQGVLGGRIPDYHKFADKITAEDYINIDRQNKREIPLDPELLFYRKEYWKIGIKPVKVIPNYFNDHESLNYGVLLVWKNPFHNKWYRWIASKLFEP